MGLMVAIPPALPHDTITEPDHTAETGGTTASLSAVPPPLTSPFPCPTDTEDVAISP